MNIIKYPDPILSQKCIAVNKFDNELRDFCIELRNTMKTAQGAGLSAPQVGDSRQIAVINSEETEYQVLINPKISFPKNAQLVTGMEGCLSLPGVFGPVARYNLLSLNYQDLNGAKKAAKIGGLLAVVVQHEVDHLGGRLFIDKMNKKNRLIIEPLINKLKNGEIIEINNK